MSQPQPTPEATAEPGVNLEAGLEERNDNTGTVQPCPFFLSAILNGIEQRAGVTLLKTHKMTAKMSASSTL